MGSICSMQSCNTNSDTKNGIDSINKVESEILQEYKKELFIKSASKMLGKSLIVNGVVKEVYKNINNEVVIYMKGDEIPIGINCTLTHSDIQVIEPIKLGQNINLQGLFTQINKQMFLKGCRLLSSSPTI